MGKHGYTGYIRVYKVYSITRVFMGTQGYTGYTVFLGKTWVHKIYRGIEGIQYYWAKHGCTRYIGVCRVYSTTRVNMGTQGI